MAHRSNRGHASHTYDIQAVHRVDEDTLTITWTDAAHAESQSQSLTVPTVTPAARQILLAVRDGLRVVGDGDVESAVTLRASMNSVSRVLIELSVAGVTDFADSGLTLSTLRHALSVLDDNTKRSVNKILARALRGHHPDGTALARALSNTAYMVREPTTTPYEDAEVEAIERAARGVLTAAVVAQRSAITALGFDTSDRRWLSLTAAEIIAAAEEQFPDVRTAEPPTSQGEPGLVVAWAVTHLNHYDRLDQRAIRHGRLYAVDKIFPALLPDAAVLVAGLILHCLAEDTGMNLASMLRTEPADLTRAGADHAILHTSKARSHSEERLPVSTKSMFSLGGLVETLTGLTRFARLHRAVGLERAGVASDVADKLYVEHRADPRKAQIITNQRMHHGWRSAAFDAHWPSPDIDREECGLRFRALRSHALHRAIRRDPDNDIVGHTPRTRLHYLAHVLPEHVLTDLAGQAQDDIVAAAMRQFFLVDKAETGTARTLADTPTERRADLVTSVCTNGGNDPDQPATPCSLGLAACFTCPNGYRTADHIPGLLATVSLTELIHANDPDEWANGDAAALHFYASESLRQFPSTVVDTVRERTDLTAHIVTISSLYTEMRR